MAVNFTLAYRECVRKSSPLHFTTQCNNNVQLVWFRKYGKSQVLTLINCNWSAHEVVNQELNQVFLSSFSLITSYHIAHMMIQYRDWMSKIRHLLFHRREVRPQILGCSQAQPDQEGKITRLAPRLMGEPEKACIARGQHYRNCNMTAWP
jgi:hypothetical protein